MKCLLELQGPELTFRVVRVLVEILRLEKGCFRTASMAKLCPETEVPEAVTPTTSLEFEATHRNVCWAYQLRNGFDSPRYSVRDGRETDCRAMEITMQSLTLPGPLLFSSPNRASVQERWVFIDALVLCLQRRTATALLLSTIEQDRFNSYQTR
jgi:hypothetical protein